MQPPTAFGLDRLSLTGKLLHLDAPPATSQLFGILIAGDESSIVEKVARALGQHWFPIHQAVGGHQAVIVAKARQPMVAIIDFSLRDHFGARSCFQIRRTCPDTQLVVTADTECELEAREAGFPVLPQPLDAQDLLGLLGRLSARG